jgi:hypothetical protein
VAHENKAKRESLFYRRSYR